MRWSLYAARRTRLYGTARARIVDVPSVVASIISRCSRVPAQRCRHCRAHLAPLPINYSLLSRADFIFCAVNRNDSIRFLRIFSSEARRHCTADRCRRLVFFLSLSLFNCSDHFLALHSAKPSISMHTDARISITRFIAVQWLTVRARWSDDRDRISAFFAFDFLIDKSIVR